MKKLNKEYRFVLIIVIIAIIGILFSNFCNNLVEKTRQETIKNAVLIESDENSYTLDFFGEEYEYTFN